MQFEPDLLPTNIEAERYVLGAVLLDDTDFGPISAALSVDDFSLERNRRIFDTMATLYSAGGAIDRVTVFSWMRDHGTAGSDELTYLISLTDGLPDSFALDSYIRFVKEKSVLRRAIVAMTKSIRDMQLNGDSREVLENAEKTIRELSSEAVRDRRLKTAGEIVIDHGGLDTFLKNNMASVRTPWQGLNHLLGGGLRDGELVILGARPSVGKTATALQFAEAASADGVVSALYSLEMGAKPLLHRMACARSKVDSNAMRTNKLNRDQRQKLSNAMSEIAALPLYFDDTAACTVAAIHASLRKLMAVQPVGFVVIDYLQLVEAPGKYENRTQTVSAVSRGLKLAAMDFGIPFLVLSQLKRMESEGGKVSSRRPTLQDLRESGSIEQDADIVMFLHAKEQTFGDIRETELIVAKQRNGPVGTVPMNFHKSHTRLEEDIQHAATA